MFSKRNKDDHDIGYNSNLNIYGSDRLYVLLSLIHGFNPEELTLSTIISIPKNSYSCLSDINNYRGIFMFSSIVNFFDYIILERSNEQ